MVPVDEQGTQRDRQSRRTVGDWISQAILGVVVATILIASWTVVAVSLVVLYQTGLVHGMSGIGAAAVAVPATFVPAWRSWSVVRAGQGLLGALTSHIWVLNGSVGYAVVAMAVMGLVDSLLFARSARSSLLLLAAVAGFVALTATLIGVNLWFFRWRMDRPATVGDVTMVPPAEEAESSTG